VFGGRVERRSRWSRGILDSGGALL
jgi:hypothetical protein